MASRPLSEANRSAAISCYEQALAIDPASIGARLGMAAVLVSNIMEGWSHSAEADGARAEQLLLDVLHDDAELPNGHLFMGSLRRLQGRMIDARIELEIAIALAPNNPVGHNQLGATLVFLGQTGSGDATFREVAAIGAARPQHPGEPLLPGTVPHAAGPYRGSHRLPAEGPCGQSSAVLHPHAAGGGARSQGRAGRGGSMLATGGRDPAGDRLILRNSCAVRKSGDPASTTLCARTRSLSACGLRGYPRDPCVVISATDCVRLVAELSLARAPAHPEASTSARHNTKSSARPGSGADGTLTAVCTRTSFASGSTRIAWPWMPINMNWRRAPGSNQV